MNKTFALLSIPAALTITLTGCMSGARHSSQLHSERERRMTVGLVQKEIREGMSQTDVAAALGSPNIVTKDGDGTEAWIYDKIATEASYSTDAGGVAGGIGAGGAPGARALVLGGVGAKYGKGAGAAATTQRTLTVIIKFSEVGLVKSFTYHASRF